MPQHIILSNITKNYIQSLAAEGRRSDGRPFEKYRAIRLRVGHIAKAEGSAEVWLGHTRVLAGIKLKTGDPYPDTPNSGTLSTSAELNPLAAPDFEAGPPQPAGIELARVVDRGIRESGVIDFDRLCIVPGEKVWMVFLDLHILDYDGNLFDACSIAALAATLSAHVPNKQYAVAEADVPLPLRDPPISCTFAKIGNVIVTDPGLDEDLVLDSRLTVAIDREGSVRAMQKGGSGSFTVDEVKTIIKRAQNHAPQLRQLIQDAIASGEATLSP